MMEQWNAKIIKIERHKGAEVFLQYSTIPLFRLEAS